jgi:hypothetical protein
MWEEASFLSLGEGHDMAIHDWTRVDPGLFHHFHQEWATSLCNALNAGKLPPDYFALVEQNIRGPTADGRIWGQSAFRR